MITTIKFSDLLADPLLGAGALLFVIGLIVFFFSLVKFLTTKKSPSNSILPNEPLVIPEPEPEPATEHQEQSWAAENPAPQKTEPSPEPQPVPVTPKEEPKVENINEKNLEEALQSITKTNPPQNDETPATAPSKGSGSEKKKIVGEETLVMPPVVSELQAQFEIALTQIKNMNKKIFELENEMERLQNQASSKLETNELKEPPMDASDFTHKLLKIAEHVIFLEKEVSKLKSGDHSKQTSSPTPVSTGGRQGTAENNPKPPIMPI